MAVAALATAMGVGGVYAAATPKPHSSNQVALTANENVKGTTYYRSFPESLKNQGTFHYGGLKYTGTDLNHPAISDHAASEEVLMLYSNVDYGTVTYDTLDFSGYTGLKDVIIVANDLRPFQPILEALPSGVNLYIAGGANFGTSLNNSKFTNLYICNHYLGGFYSIGGEDFINALAGSSLKNIYYNTFIEERDSYSLNKLKEAPRQNKNAEAITISKAPSIKYPKEVFYITADFRDESTVFGATTYYSCGTNVNITSTRSLSEKVISVDPRVKDVAFNKEASAEMLSTLHNYGKVYMRSCSNMSTLSEYKIDELITTPGRMTSIDFSKCRNIKAVRLIRPLGKASVTDAAIQEDSLLKKIYIPNQYKEDYADVYNNPKYQPLIEYYDLEPTAKYYNSYLADDGKQIYCSKGTLTIDKCELARQKLDAMGVAYDNAAVDSLLNTYEVRLDDNAPIEGYKHRSLDTIVVPKNMDAKTLLEEYKFVLITDNLQLSISNEGTNILVDSSKYTVGKNGTLKVTITYPDKTVDVVDVNVRHMPVEGEIGYVLGVHDICVITKVTKQNVPLADLMNPIMENYLMESSAEYTVSPILDTSKNTFITANRYKTVSNQGILRVLTTDNDLVPVEPAPNPSPDAGGETTPEGGGQETPDNGGGEVKPGVDTDGIDIEGLAVKNPIGVYTPNTIDGSKLFSGLADNIATYKGQPLKDIRYAIAYNRHDNTKDWEFSIFHTFNIDGKKDRYDKRITAHIIESKYNIGFVVFEDGTIAVEYNLQENYTAAQVKEATAAFLKSIGKEYTILVIPETPLTQVYEGNYDDNKILLVNSGYNLKFTSEAKPDEQAEVKKGYTMPNTIYYTKSFTKEQALRVLADKLLRKDGALVKNYEIVFDYKADGEGADYIVKVDGKEVLKKHINLKLIESEYEYIFTTMYDYDSGFLIMNTQKEAPKYTLNDIMSDALKNFRSLMSPFDNKATIDFTKAGKADVDGTYMVGNGSYYKYEYDVEVMDVNKYCEDSKVIINGKTGKETLKEKADGFFAGLKKKFEENKVFKGFTIAFGTITGLALLYGLYIIFKKVYKWLRG